MGELEEDRIYADTLGKTDVYVAAGLGVVEVSVSNDRIGQFSLYHRCAARDIAADGTDLLVATDEDVLAIDPAGDEPVVEQLGFGPAVAVGGGDAPLAAAPDGTVARATAEGWTELGTVTEPRAIDGPLIATADGVVRVDDGLEHVGLDDVRDVVGGPTPYAATANGLYRLGPGWTRELDAATSVVAAEDSRVHAVTADGLFVTEGDGWRERETPTDEPLVDVGYIADGGVVAVTATGRFLVDPAAAKDGASGWRTRALGLAETTGFAIPAQ
ncbi:HVO_0234 family beta-propeller protein [Halapricum hydrolyticum]|uniref:HVO-0234-like beta-propeller domain-containing protein n=1 Tax=Halapricum hydrolyticum TaxID=2979991 RepID=A0AAE3ICR1_9EURY|nr:hypothetical protein [Halapricum hydrolyticum]MCU4719513.1 hypothetical protein [Halapricum hydrolyticum]MCU4728203.1 hypothetical protein [Halapricum hydrolyticum]